MTEIIGGELFARGLRAEGIEFLFELPSPEVDPLLAGGGRAYGRRLYKTTGKVAAVLGIPGPGVGEPPVGHGHRPTRGRTGARHHPHNTGWAASTPRRRRGFRARTSSISCARR
jgi:hypothetical protein